MYSNVQRLYEIAGKPSRLVIGLMSGTSFDGLDIALCNITGSGLQTQVKILAFETVDYAPQFKEALKEVFAQRHAGLEKITLLNETTGVHFATLILQCLEKWGVQAKEIDLIASHGQTIYHAPKTWHHNPAFPNGTLQIGDGDHIAVKTGIITLSDFRQKHIAAGGEGAPLAVYGDYLLFSVAAENRIMLNIGGIANYTWLPATQNASEVFSTDVGPGNTLMDQYIQKNVPGSYYDENAALAKKGKVSSNLLAELLSNPFFTADFPKTTGPELFSLAYLDKACQKTGVIDLSIPDMMATLCHFSATAIVDAINKGCKTEQYPVIYVSGGGIHNPLLMELIKERLSAVIFKETSTLGIDPDAKEAVLFAVLANESIAGNKPDFGNRQGIPAVNMGKISFPD